jgi:uncharacterized membrane protein YedE/YeeE
MKRILSAFGCGLLFGAGLVIGGMTRPSKVVGFLDLFGNWDASLAFVMGGAVAVNAIAYHFVVRRAHPVLAEEFAIPKRIEIDGRLIGGAVLFGVGWGLAGYCPGPAVTSLLSGHLAPPIFMIGMVAGMFGYSLAAEHIGSALVARPEPGVSFMRQNTDA